MTTISSSSRVSGVIPQPKGAPTGARARRSIRVTLAALMTSTALVCIAPHHTRAAEKLIDGVSETINDAQTFEKLTVGRDQSNSELTVDTGGNVSVVNNNNGEVFIGINGGSEGTLTISGGGVLTAEKEVRAASVVGSKGTITVSGAGSTLKAGGPARIGFNGDGVLNVLDGGEFSAETFSSALSSAGSTADITVSGAGSKLTTTEFMRMARVGTGTLTINSGGVVEAGSYLELGKYSGSDATLIIGAASGQAATAAGRIQGKDGAAATIRFGAGAGKIVFNHTDTNLDFNANVTGNGDIEVFSGTTTLSGTNDIGTGDILVDGGELKIAGTTTADGLDVGKASGSSGTVTISGNGSTLTATGKTYIGNSGNGTLTITNQGEATAGSNVVLGNSGGSSGTATISGSGSKLNAGGNITVGNNGAGTLTVSDGGEVGSDANVTIGNFVSGTATISGRGSKLTAGANLTVGNLEDATLTVLAGGEAKAVNAVNIGLNNGSTSTVTISGTGSKLTAGVATNVGAGGAGTLTVTNGGYADTGGTFIVGKDSTGSGTVTISGAGSKVKNGFATYFGKNGQGTLTISDGGQFDGSEVVFIGQGAGSVGTVTVTGAGSKLHGGLRIGDNGVGMLTLSNGGVAEEENATQIARFAGSTGTLNIGAASGDAAIAAGTIQGANGARATLAFGAGTGKLVFNHTGTAYDFDAKVSGNGTVSQEAGFTSLTGDFSGFTGTGSVSGGTLSVNTAFVGAMNVLSGGTLTGSGSVGALDFAAGSTYGFDFDGKSGLTSTGAITIASGSKLAVEFSDPANVSIWKPTTVLTGNSVTGTFGTTNAKDYLFLDIGVSTTATSVQVDVDRSNTTFASIASTPNQTAIANALDGLANGNDVYDTFATLKSASDARNAFNLLSGEAHASLQGGLTSGAGMTRDIVGGQIRSSFGGIAARTMDQTTTASIGRFEPAVKAIVARTYDVWGQVYGAFGRTDGDSNSAQTKRSTGGVLFGAETGIGSDWRVGGFTGYGYTGTAVDERKSRANADSYTIGAFAGRLFGPARVQFGSSVSRHQISSSRDVAFSSFTDHLQADYGATTLQAFGEVGYAIWADGFAFEPFAGAALVYQHTGAFTESGGAAALSASASSGTLGITTVGVRTGFDFGRFANGTSVRLDGSLAWQHAFGDVTSQTTMAFASGSNAFTVSGTPLDTDTALIETGLTFGLENGMDFSLGYSGAIGKSAQDHTFNARLKARF